MKIKSNRASGRKHVSPLQAKGFFTLALVLLAESVTFSNAVKLWASYQAHHHNSGDFGSFERETPFSRASRAMQECLAGSDAESCRPTNNNNYAPVSRRITLGR